MMTSRTKVPDGWRQVRLGDVATEVNDRANGDSNAEVYSVTKYDGFVRSLEYFDRQVFSRDTRNYKLVRKGDFAYATIHLDEGSLGMLRDANAALISPMYTVFRVDAQAADPEFLFPLMKLPNMINRYKRIGEGSIHRRKSVSFERLSSLPILLPPLTEQRAIATVLDSIDDAIEQTEAVIATMEQLRDSLLYELLTRGVPGWHTEWNEAPGVGTIPADWKVVRLGEVAEVASGQVDPRDRGFQLDLFVAPDDIESGTGRLISKRTVADAAAISGKYQFSNGDILYSKIRPYLKKVYMPKEPGLCSADIYPLRSAPGLEPHFLAAVLLSAQFTDYIRTCSDRTGIPKVNRVDLFRYSISLPPLAEQRSIAAALDSVDEAIRRARQERDGLQSLLESAAEALLTGRIRTSKSCRS